MKALLCREGSVRALDRNYPDDMTTAEIEEMEEKRDSIIHLSLFNKMLHKVVDEERASGLRNKFESFYMKKSLMTILFLK